MHFIFNTFNTRPPTKPMVKEYDYEGHHFVEVGWRISKTKMVHHIQVRDGMEPHETSFKWITPSQFRRILESERFRVMVRVDGRTSIYVCTRK